MSDLLLPGSLATWDPLGGTPEPQMTGHDGVAWHTMAGTFVGTDAYFHRDGWGGVESHVGVAGSGAAKLWTPWNRQADAMLHGNPRWLSIENADKGENFQGDSDDEPPFTAAQITKGIDLGVYWCDVRNHRACPSTWTCHREGIPPRFISNSCERGIGTHWHGIVGRGLVDGCPVWSTSPYKLCPRLVRHRQVRDIIVPGIRRRLIGGFLMALTDDQQQEVLAAARQVSGIKFVVDLLWKLNTPNGFRWVKPDTFELVPAGTAGAVPVFDTVRWSREAAVGARSEEADHEAELALLRQLQELHTSTGGTQ